MKIHTETLLAVALSMIVLGVTGPVSAYANPVAIDLPPVSTYPTISAAYAAAATEATIMLQGILFDENLSFGDAKTVLLKGGYNSDFTSNAGNSVVRGTLSVSGGAVQVQNVLLRKAETPPDAPTGVTATNGITPDTVIVSFSEGNSGSGNITGYTVNSIPPGITTTGTASPITVTCHAACPGHAFTVTASSTAGNSAPSTAADIITDYNIIETFYEPDTQPNDSIFVGSFTLNSTTKTVTNLYGTLSEAMTCIPGACSLPYPNDTMTWLPLLYQLSAEYDSTLGGLLVTTFKNNNTNTFFGSSWKPAAGVAVGGVYYGFPGANPGNAYAMIFVNPVDPTRSLTQAQIDKLAYADCTTDGMMGAVCMTGTSLAGYGASGTMGGYPVSQVITKKP